MSSIVYQSALKISNDLFKYMQEYPPIFIFFAYLPPISRTFLITNYTNKSTYLDKISEYFMAYIVVISLIQSNFTMSYL